MRLFLGVDGGQTHTAAVLADGSGHILGRGRGGPSNHARAGGGRARLERAVRSSVGEALAVADLVPAGADFSGFRLASAHFALTGETRGKYSIVCRLVCADRLTVGHDAPAAHAGATGASDGVVVLGGTGSVAYGRKGERRVRIGGNGYVFGDEGSAFAIARLAVSRAIKDQDRRRPCGALRAALLEFFGVADLRAIPDEFYAGTLTRDRLAAFSPVVIRLAREGDRIAQELICGAARDLAEMAAAAAGRLQASTAPIRVSYAGGVFRSREMLQSFKAAVQELLPFSTVAPPRYGAEIGALLIAYQQAGKTIGRGMLRTLDLCGRTNAKIK